MPLILTDAVASTGIIADTDPRKLPDGAWSDGYNVRFSNGLASKVKGSRTVQGSLSTSAYSIFPYTTFDGSMFFAYAGLTAVYGVNNNTHYDLTRVAASGTAIAYSANADDLWNGGVLGGLLFLNNGIDVPQVQLTPTASCRLQDLPNWPTTITTRAACLRAYKNFLVALDVTKGAQRYRQMVKWSASADPLTVPTTWDEADTTKDAGEYSLSETDGTVIDCLPLRDINILYKDDSVWGMQYIGGTFVFRFYQMFSRIGLLAKNCVAAFGEFHCFIGNDLDIYVHNGQSIRSIAEGKWRKWLRDTIDGSKYKRAFVVDNPATSEMWICIPDGTQEYCSKALMWNWREDTWGVRTIDNVSDAAPGGIQSSDYLLLWSTITSTWDTEASAWSELENLPPEKKLVMVSPSRKTGLIETEFGSSEFGDPLPASLERTGIWAQPTKVHDGARQIDLQNVKFIKRVRFRTTDPAPTHGVVFSVAVQNDLNSPLVWVSTNKLTQNTAELTVFKRGRFLSLKVETTEDELFNVLEYEVDVEGAGDYL